MCKDGMGVEELALDRVIPWEPMWPEFYFWARQQFDLTDDSWNPAGAVKPYLGSLPYGKMIHSIYLIVYGLSDNHNWQWHSHADYRDAARATDNEFHDWQEYRSRQAGKKPTSEATTPDGDGGEINMHCHVFNLGSIADNPSNRASVMIHESWHHWQHKHGFVSTHPQGNKDWYYPHRVGAYEFGYFARYWIDPSGANRHKFHSPYQVAVEFDADIAEYARSFIPIAVTTTARSNGNARLADAFVNAPGYLIGNPRPF